METNKSSTSNSTSTTAGVSSTVVTSAISTTASNYTSVTSTISNATGVSTVVTTSASKAQASSTALIKKEADKSITPTTSVTFSQIDTASMPKKMKINLNSEDKAVAKEGYLKANDPNEVYANIDKEMAIGGGQLEYTHFMCRSICVGSYKVTSSELHSEITAQFTSLGIRFSLPHAYYKHKRVTLCIPIDCILHMEAHFQQRLRMIFITTEPKYAKWVHQNLGLDGSPANESSNYFCPVNGSRCQQSITMLGSDYLDESDIGMIIKIYWNVIEELNYVNAIELLMQNTPGS